MKSPDRSESSLPIDTRKRLPSVNRANVFTGLAFGTGLALAVGNFVLPKPEARVDSGVVTGKTLEWEESTVRKQTRSIAGFQIYSVEDSVVDDPDFILTIKSCEKQNTTCIENPVFVTEEIYEATKVGDIVDFSADPTVSFDDPDIESENHLIGNLISLVP